MSMANVNPVEEKAPGRSALENFASAMGILSSLGNLGISAYGAFNPKPNDLQILGDMMKNYKTAVDAANTVQPLAVGAGQPYHFDFSK